MWLIEAFLALMLIPAALGVPLYLAGVLGLNLYQGQRGVAVSAGVALAGWLLLTVKLVILPALYCMDGCNTDGHLSLGFAGYVLVSASLGLAVWWHQRSRSGPPSASPQSAHAGR